MKKKILLLAAALMMFMGIVSASSINGDYKGNPIVKVMSNGKQLQSDEVPAQIYDGHTVVPISLLRQLGASVEWNQDTYSVDVKMPQSAPVNASVNLLQLRYDLINEVSVIDYSIDENGMTNLTFLLKFNSVPEVDDKYSKVINVGTAAGVDRLSLVEEKQDGNVYIYKTNNIKDFISKKLTADEFKSKIEIQPKIQQSSNKPVEQNQSIIPQQQTQPQQTQNQNNNTQIIAQYNLLSDFNLYLQSSVNSISNFVNTSDNYYYQWNSGNSAAPASLEGDVTKTLGILNDINNKGNQVYPQMNAINLNKTSEIIKEIYSLNAPINKTYESITGWKVSKFNLTDEKYKPYNTNLQVAEQYLNEYKASTSELLNKIIQITNELKVEYDSQKNIVKTLGQ